MIEPTGAYSTARAAALAGVPSRTLNYWVTSGLITPTVSPEPTRLWSFEDLVRIRTVVWLRREKEVAGGRVKGVGLPTIRKAIEQLRGRGIAWWDVEESPLRVTPAGQVLVIERDQLSDLAGQTLISDAFDPLAPFEDDEHELLGPDLLRPRNTLRIRPGNLSGEPHVNATRVETQAIFALITSGYDVADIIRLYPFLAEAQVNDAVDLEQQLARNVTSSRAA